MTAMGDEEYRCLEPFADGWKSWGKGRWNWVTMNMAARRGYGGRIASRSNNQLRLGILPYVQSQADKLLRPFRKFVNGYIDDIVAFSKMDDEEESTNSAYG